MARSLIHVHNSGLRTPISNPLFWVQPRCFLLYRAGVQWVLWSDITDGLNELPANAIKGGFQIHDDTRIVPNYVARAAVGDAIVPCIVSRNDPKDLWLGWAAWGDKQSVGSVRTLEVATADPDSVHWQPAANGDVPRGAVQAGVAVNGEPLYVCRVMDSSRVLGGLHFMVSNGAVSCCAHSYVDFY